MRSKTKRDPKALRRTQHPASGTTSILTMSHNSFSDGEHDTEIIFQFVSRALEIIRNDGIMVQNSTPRSPPESPATIEVDPNVTRQSSRFVQSPQHPQYINPPIPAQVIEKSSSSLHHCGQFTFYFPRCSHATSHLFHLNTWSGTVCNKNCVYDQGNDYWFYADEGSHCSYCGLGQIYGIGAKQTIPDETDDKNSKAREVFFERLITNGKLCAGPVDEEARQEYNEYYLRAVLQYNKLIDAIPTPCCKPTILTPAQERTKRRGRLLDRWDIRRLRARKRTEEWVKNIRIEQYDKTKAHVEVGSRPYIVTPTGNPHMDLYTTVQIKALPLPIDNCAWCQFGLASQEAITESGGPSSLPCGHTFHYNCIVELFEKRTKAGEKERHKCPLCNVWFKDVREIPDFYGRYREKEHAFDSDAQSSVLSGSEMGDLKGHLGPPWLEEWLTESSETVDGEDEGDTDSIDIVHPGIQDEAKDADTENCSVETQYSEPIPQQLEPATVSISQQTDVSDLLVNEAIAITPPPSLHVGHELSDDEGLSYIVTLQLPSPGFQRRTSRRRRRPRRWVEECGRVPGPRLRGRGRGRPRRT